MKLFVSSSLVLALSAVSANAAAFNDLGERALFQFTGGVTADPTEGAATSVTLTSTSAIASATEEFEGLLFQTPTFVTSPFIVSTSQGDIDPDIVFTVAYDRTNVTDNADMPLGSEVGTLQFTLTDITFDGTESTGLGTNYTIFGGLEVVDITAGGAFYDPASGNFRINAEFTDLDDSYTLIVGVPSLSTTDVPLPASALLLISGLIGLGYAGARRRA